MTAEYMQDDYVCCHRMTAGPCEMCRRSARREELGAKISRLETAMDLIDFNTLLWERMNDEWCQLMCDLGEVDHP